MRRLEVAVVVSDTGLRGDLVHSVRAAGCAARPVASSDPLDPATWPGLDVVLMQACNDADVDAIADLHARNRTLRIIAIGSSSARRVDVEARAAGAAGYVRMPFDVDGLERVLTEATERAEQPGADECFVTADRGVDRILSRAASAAGCDATIVIRGETGTGKSTLAHWIHQHSRWRHGPIVTCSCAGLSGETGGLELFGSASSEGLLGSAQGGTLTLDGVEDLDPALQERLLEVLLLDAGDMRLIATTKIDLAEAALRGQIQEALQLRLGVIELALPPLRERPDDIELLARGMLERAARRQGSPVPRLGEAALVSLRGCPLRGNAWELESLMERAALLFAGCEVDPAVLFSTDPPESVATGMPPTLNLKHLEREAITLSLARRGGNRTRASRDLGISVRTLRNKIREYGLA